MGICTSCNTNRKKEGAIKARFLNKQKAQILNNKEISSTISHKLFSSEKILSPIDENDIKKNNITMTSNHNNNKLSDNDSKTNNNQSSFQSDLLDKMNEENIPYIIEEKKNNTNINSLKSKEENTIATHEQDISIRSKKNKEIIDTKEIKDNEEFQNNKNNNEMKVDFLDDKDNINNIGNKNNIENNNNNENKNIIDSKNNNEINSNSNNNKEIKEKGKDRDRFSKSSKHNNINYSQENVQKKELISNSDKNNKDIKINNDKKESNNIIIIDSNIIIKKKETTKKNNEELYEDESLMSFFKDFNKSNIYDNSSSREIINNNIPNNNYYLYKGNLFNLNFNINNLNYNNDSNINSETNETNLYYFSEFHFTQKKNYSSEKDFNNLLNSQIFKNKILLTNKLLNLQERQWYKESISLSDSLKANRENIYIDTASFTLYLNKIINLYNHFNWLTWAVSYYYFNSLLFNKNHWFNSKNTNLPSYDNLEWIRGFEWKGIYIKVMTYNDAKKVIKEIKALKYAFLEYIKIIDTFNYQSNNLNINGNLLSNEIIFPFITYTYFGGVVLYFSGAIKKFYYEENSFIESSKDNSNSNTKANTKSFENKEKQFDEISEITLFDSQKMKNKNNFLNFNNDHINLRENVINYDINISGYSKIDLINSKIFGKITENNLIKIVDDLDNTSNINYEKYKFMLTNVYSLLPSLFIEETQDKKDINDINEIGYIKFKNDSKNPRIYDIVENDIKANEIDSINNLLYEKVDESSINIYQNNLNGVNYRIIYQKNCGIKNEKVTKYFVKFPHIQNKVLSSKIINEFLKDKNINFLMHNFQKKHKQEITDNNIILYKVNLHPKMKYTLLSKDNKETQNLTKNNFKIFIEDISKNIISYKVEMRNVDNLLNFCEKNGLNPVFLPFLLSEVNNESINNLIKIYIFCKIIKDYFVYYQGQNFLMKLAIYEACKNKDILNSTDSSCRDNNMIELERNFLSNIIKFFLLPYEFSDSIFYEKSGFAKDFMESFPFFVFLHTLKIKKFEKFFKLATFLTKKDMKELINEYGILCRNNPFLFIDTLEKLINFRMNPYLKYRASMDLQNLKDLKKEEIIIFAPKVNTFMEFTDIAGYLFNKCMKNNNNINNSIFNMNNNLLLSMSNCNATKIGKVDTCMIKQKNSKINNNITKIIPDSNEDENNNTIINNGVEDLSGSSLQQISNYAMGNMIKNQLINNNSKTAVFQHNIIINEKEKNQKFNLKNIFSDIILDNFISPKIDKINLNNNESNIDINLNVEKIEENIKDYNSYIEKIFGEVIAFNGQAELIIFKIYIYKIMKEIFFTKNLKQARELILKLKEKFEKQYLFTFNQWSILSFLESLTYDKYKDSLIHYTKSLIFALFNLGDVRCNNCNGHQFLLLPIYIICKITGYCDCSDTNEYFKEMFRCLNFKINKYLKKKGIDDKNKNKKLIYYQFPSVSDLKLKNNDFLYTKDFVTFLINSILSFFYSGDSLLIDNDFLSYFKINFKHQKKEEDVDKNSLTDHKSKNSNSTVDQSFSFINDILLDKMSFLKYGPSDIVISFGKNDSNQTSHDNYEMLTLPRLIYKLTDLKVKKIFSGYDYNFIIDSKHDVYSWGENSCGQCGHPEKKIITSPKKVFFGELSKNDYIEYISCSKNITYFISYNKKIFLCGYNLILNKTWKQPTLLELNFDSNISQIKSGEDFSLFLTEKGNLYSVGFGSEGQLGIPNIKQEFENKKICQKPTKILNSIKSIECGAKFAFALSYNDIVFCWGENLRGQLGLIDKNEKDVDKRKYVSIPEKMEHNYGIDITDIKCGKDFTFFKTKNNDLLGCGNNAKDQLGISNNSKNTNKSCNDVILPTEIEQFSFLIVNRLSCGEKHSIAAVKDNSSNLLNIWCWGSNEFGQLGLGSNIISSKPKPNHYLLEFINHKPVDISTGSNHSMILLQRKDFNEKNSDEMLKKLIYNNSKL